LKTTIFIDFYELFTYVYFEQFFFTFFHFRSLQISLDPSTSPLYFDNDISSLWKDGVQCLMLIMREHGVFFVAMLFLIDLLSISEEKYYYLR